MSWSMRRRLIVIGIIAVAIAAALGIFYFTTIHQGPSCSDNKQDQGEQGIDCGGPCSYVCTESEAAPSVRFVRPFVSEPGRTDVIAYIDNPNPSVAARALPYTLELYSDSNQLLGKRDGTLDLPPGATVPVFIAAAYVGDQTVARAFLTFATPPHFWYRASASGVKPSIENIKLTSGRTPRITATAVNPSTTALSDVAFVVTIFNSAGNAIAASRTLVPSIPGLGQTPLIFTWNAPFSDSVSRIEVLPVVPLAQTP